MLILEKLERIEAKIKKNGKIFDLELEAELSEIKDEVEELEEEVEELKDEVEELEEEVEALEGEVEALKMLKGRSNGAF